MKMIEETFGSMKLIWHEFTNCGVRHIQDKTTFECSLDQTEYISGLKTISHDEIRGKSSNSYCEPLLHTLYQSLLGAVAFTSLTRVDIIVFVVALQRHTHKPQIKPHITTTPHTLHTTHNTQHTSNHHNATT